VNVKDLEEILVYRRHRDIPELDGYYIVDSKLYEKTINGELDEITVV